MTGRTGISNSSMGLQAPRTSLLVESGPGVAVRKRESLPCTSGPYRGAVGKGVSSASQERKAAVPGQAAGPPQPSPALRRPERDRSSPKWAARQPEHPSLILTQAAAAKRPPAQAGSRQHRGETQAGPGGRAAGGRGGAGTAGRGRRARGGTWQGN